MTQDDHLPPRPDRHRDRSAAPSRLSDDEHADLVDMREIGKSRVGSAICRIHTAMKTDPRGLRMCGRSTRPAVRARLRSL